MTTADTFWFLLMLCIWCHIIDDFVLQSFCLCDLKQKSWWKKQIGSCFEFSPYREDYVVALVVHGASWSIATLLPIIAWYFYTETQLDVPFLWTAFFFNAIIHATIDNIKANLMLINLVTDQTLHLVQIVVTLAIFMHRAVI